MYICSGSISSLIHRNCSAFNFYLRQLDRSIQFLPNRQHERLAVRGIGFNPFL